MHPSHPSKWRVVCGLAAVLAVAPAASGQQAPPHIGYAYPAGGRQGATFQILIGGQYLDNVSNAYISGPGVKAVVVEHTKPMTQQQFNDLREKLAELLKKPPDAETAKEIADIRKKMSTFVRRPASPSIVETVTLQVTVAPDAAVGQRELRLLTPLGLSNPLAIKIGQLPEFSKTASANIENMLDLRALRSGTPPVSNAFALPMNVTLPTVINGQTAPGGVDRYRFDATKGQRLVVAVEARELVPYIADAVPGWFQAAVALYDAGGKELDYADHFRFHPDPAFCYEIPKDGQYMLAVRDSLYRGREDFVYRITIGEVPFITGIFPLGGKVGEKTAVELIGWNLPTTRLTQNLEGKGAGVYPLSVLKGDWTSNSVPFAADAMPEVTASKSIGTPQDAQAVTLPVIVNGRIERAGQWDVFRFEGRAGEEIVAEVCARRLGSPLDSVLRLTDAAGKQLAFNDDHEDKGSGLNTHHADSYIRAKLPAGGTYYVHLGDIQQQGGPEYAYRLRLSAPQPDFELRVTPSSVNLRGGGTVPITVYALRKDGFSDAIELTLKDAPGFTLSGGRVPTSQDQVRLTLTAPTTPPGEPAKVCIEGHAKIQGREVVKKAVPAEDMMQAFAYRHLVPAQALEVAVSARFSARTNIQLLSPTPIRIPAGKTVKVLVGLPQNTMFGNILFELDEPPAGVSLQGSSPIGRGTELVLQADAAKVKPGMEGNLIVNVVMLARPPAAAVAKAPTTSPASAPSSPANAPGTAPASTTGSPASATSAAPATGPTTASGKAAITAPSTPPTPPPGQPTQRRVPLGTLPAIPFVITASGS